MLRYLFWCANEHTDFRLAEFEALSRLFDIPLNYVEKNTREPWIILDLPSEAEAKQILTRSIATKYCIEIWGDGHSYEDVHAKVKAYPKDRVTPYLAADQSFKVYVEGFMKKFNLEQRLEKIEAFNYIPFAGPVRMKDPDNVFSLFEFYGLDQNRLPDAPRRVFFGRCVGEGRRDLIPRMSIKTRRFIGNTTMDPQLSLLMSNLALVRDGSLVLDPFVGTGSLLVAAAQFGGYVLGGDIDYLLLHARTRPSRVGQKKRAADENIRANFEQYGLESRYRRREIISKTQS